MPFFRVTLDGVHVGQNIVNVLWYRTTFPVPTLGDFLGYAEALAAEVEESVWDNGAPDCLKSTMLSTYTLQNIVVNGVDDDGAFISTDPYVLPVNEAGGWAQTSDSSALCAIMKANLEPAFGPGIGLPRRGYLAIGPLASIGVENNGLLSATVQDALIALGLLLAANITTEFPPGVFYPCRVRRNPTGLPFPFGYRDVSSFVPRARVSWRRSRNNVGEE